MSILNDFLLYACLIIITEAEIILPVVLLVGLYLIYGVKHKFFLITFALIIVPYTIYSVFQYFHYVAVFPSAIEVTYPISMDSAGDIREGCDIAVFKLSESTVKQIEVKGLHFFDGVTQARGHSKDSYYNRYRAWTETPIPKSWDDENRPWFMCTAIRGDLSQQISEAAKQKGTYYTASQAGILMVIPSLGFVVFSHGLL